MNQPMSNPTEVLNNIRDLARESARQQNHSEVRYYLNLIKEIQNIWNNQ